MSNKLFPAVLFTAMMICGYLNVNAQNKSGKETKEKPEKSIMDRSAVDRNVERYSPQRDVEKPEKQSFKETAKEKGLSGEHGAVCKGIHKDTKICVGKDKVFISGKFK